MVMGLDSHLNPVSLVELFSDLPRGWEEGGGGRGDTGISFMLSFCPPKGPPSLGEKLQHGSLISLGSE